VAKFGNLHKLARIGVLGSIDDSRTHAGVLTQRTYGLLFYVMKHQLIRQLIKITISVDC
jgi:hypothetical protein